MPTRLRYSNANYLNLFITDGERNKVISRICDIFAISYAQKTEAPNTLKIIIESFKHFGTVLSKMK